MNSQKRGQAALSPMMHTHKQTLATHANCQGNVFVSFSFHIIFFSFRSISFPSMSASSSTLVYNYFHLFVCTMNSGHSFGYHRARTCIFRCTRQNTFHRRRTDLRFLYIWLENIRHVMVAVGLAFSYIHIRHQTLHFLHMQHQTPATRRE